MPTIAVLDDEEAYRRALTRLLKAHGYRVIDCSTGAQLLVETSRHGVDCVILDLYMAGMSGFEVLAKLQQEPGSPPVIVVTAHDDADTRQRVKALHAFECRTKPVGAAALLDAIARALHR